MTSNSLKPIETLAADLRRLSEMKGGWSQGAGALEFMREFERHAANPDAYDELVAALEELGGSATDLILLPLPDLSFIPLAVLRQHSVGHGGFHTGAMGRGSVRLRWIYDCGSLKSEGKSRLSEEIANLAGSSYEEKRRVDLLFISHFDRDHVSGVVELMSAVSVNTVVIPYLDDIQRTSALASALAETEGLEGEAAGELISAMFDPVAWLSALGANRVFQMRPAGPDTGTSRIFDFGPGTGPEIPPEVFGGQPILVRQSASDDGLDEAHPVLEPGSGWMVTHFGRSFGDWCFIPYVSNATEEARLAFSSEMSSLLGEPQRGETMVDSFMRKMGDSTFIKKIKRAYRDHDLGDANAVSMSLYVGPSRDSVWHCRKSLRAGQEWPNAGPGWLLTGDAKLGQIGRRRSWLRFYAPLKERIGALMLPHHGSHLNFHEDILKAIRADGLVFACCGSRPSGSPLHENVWPWVKGRAYTIVSEKVGTSLLQISGASVLDSAERVLSDVAEEWR